MDTLCTATPFVGNGLVPLERIGPAKKGIYIFNLIGEGMVHFASNGGVVVVVVLNGQIDKKIKLLYYIPTSSEIVVHAVRSSPL